MVIMRIHMMAGRSREQKQQLIRATTDVAAESLEVNPDNVRIILLEIDRDNWGIAGIAASEMSTGKG